ncbi:hypothetical protein OCB70_14100 [Bacillus cereus]|nr:hypothetical protein [Bacillus cereus]
MLKSTKSGCKPNWSLFTKEIGGEMDQETNTFLTTYYSYHDKV